MKVLLTNDDGIEAEGLQALRRALARASTGSSSSTIAPDGNRSAMARTITTRRPLWVEEVDFGDGTVGYATDGTPVDCVRFATLGLVDGFDADLDRRGHQPRRRTSATTSPTPAPSPRRSRASCSALPAIAVSQQSTRRELDFRLGRSFDFERRRALRRRRRRRDRRRAAARTARC